MKFKYRKIPNNHPTKLFQESYIIAPQIPIGIGYKNNYINCYALIDSGAGACLFPSDYAKNIGIKNISSGIKHMFYGIGNGNILAYFHNMP